MFWNWSSATHLILLFFLRWLTTTTFWSCFYLVASLHRSDYAQYFWLSSWLVTGDCFSAFITVPASWDVIRHILWAWKTSDFCTKPACLRKCFQWWTITKQSTACSKSLTQFWRTIIIYWQTIRRWFVFLRSFCTAISVLIYLNQNNIFNFYLYLG